MIPILILHGWGSCSKNWDNVKELLEKQGCRVLIPDLPGFGQNPAPSFNWNIDNYVSWVKDFADKNNLGRFFLFGHSFGGTIAAKYSAKYPQNVEKLFLAAAAGIRKKSFKKAFFKKISPFFKDFLLIRQIFYKFFLKSDYPDTYGMMREIYLNIVEEDISSLFCHIKVPTILIWGDKDNITPIADAYFMREKIINSKLEILPGVSHRIRTDALELLVKKILENIK